MDNLISMESEIRKLFSRKIVFLEVSVYLPSEVVTALWWKGWFGWRCPFVYNIIPNPSKKHWSEKNIYKVKFSQNQFPFCNTLVIFSYFTFSPVHCEESDDRSLKYLKKHFLILNRWSTNIGLYGEVIFFCDPDVSPV